MKTFNLAIAAMTLIVLFAGGSVADQGLPTTKPAVVATTMSVWHDSTRDRDVPVKIYYPKDLAGPLPVIIFSHGLGGSREGYGYVGQYWAAHGYVSVHLTHHGSDTEAVYKNGAAAALQVGKQVAADPTNAVNRYKDVSFAIDRLTVLNADSSWELAGKLDLTKIGMAGHSFGAGTTMTIAGQLMGRSRSFADPRIKCAAVMCPPAPPAHDHLDAIFDPIKMPVFVLTGTEDDSPIGETKAADRRIGFDHLVHSPAFLLTFEGGDHMLFSGKRRGQPVRATDDRYYKLIQQGTTAFFDAYLKGDEATTKWFVGDGFSTSVGDAGKFEKRN